MQVIDLQNEKMPALGFGTWQLRGDECTQAVKKALEIGYRHVDTAQIYENEAEVGQGLTDGLKAAGLKRDDIFLTTKIWRSNFENAAASVDESLKKLQTDYVDLLLVHWPFPEVDMEVMINAIVSAQKAGKARLIGVSNFTVAQMEQAEKLSGEKICVNQVEYHPYLSQKPVLDFVQAKKWVLTAYSPIARGKVVDDMAIKEIALKYAKNPVQVTLRWLIQQNRVAAIPKAGTEKHIQSNFDIFDFELNEADMAAISALAKADGRLIDPDFAPKWDKAA
jgi:2,5-diketo-D-gluconate reductase B